MENKKTKFILLCVLLTGCVLTSVAAEYFFRPTAAPLPQAVQKEENTSAQIKVYVSGAVVRPGIYNLPAAARAQDAVTAAGGFTQAANPEKVNLAKKLKDGSQVNVPSQSSKKAASGSGRRSERQNAAGNYVRTVNDRVNINTAGLDELVSLPGIGEATAQKIIDYRRVQPFSKIEDLMQVKGIGQGKFQKLQDRITI